MESTIQTSADFAFYLSRGSSVISDDAMKAARKALDAAQELARTPDAMKEFHIRAQHENRFIEFVKNFSFKLKDIDKLAVFFLYKNPPTGIVSNEIAVALEFVSNYEGLFPPTLCGMRFFQSLEHLDPDAASSFAEALRTEPSLKPEMVFRKTATTHKVVRKNRNISLQKCVSYFNENELIDEMESFLIDNLVAVRNKTSRTALNYADAILSVDDFVRFVLYCYTDHKLSALAYVKRNGARAALCGSLMRTYLDCQEMDEPSLIGELDMTLRGRPAFASTPRFILDPRKASSPRPPTEARGGNRTENPRPSTPSVREAQA